MTNKLPEIRLTQADTDTETIKDYFSGVPVHTGQSPTIGRRSQSDIYELWPHIIGRDPVQLVREQMATGMPLPPNSQWRLTRYEIAEHLNDQLKAIKVTSAPARNNKEFEYDIQSLLTEISYGRFKVQDAFRAAITNKYPNYETHEGAQKALQLIDQFARTELGGREKSPDIASFLESLKGIMSVRTKDGEQIIVDQFLSPHFPWVIKVAFFVNERSVTVRNKGLKEWDEIVKPMLGFWNVTQFSILRSLLGKKQLAALIETAIWTENAKELRRVVVLLDAAIAAISGDNCKQLQDQLRGWATVKFTMQFKKSVQSVDKCFNKRLVNKKLREANASNEFKAAVEFITAYIDRQIEEQGVDPVARMKRSRELSEIVTGRLAQRFQKHVRDDEDKLIELLAEMREYADQFNWHLARNGQKIVEPKTGKKATLGVRKITENRGHFRFHISGGCKGSKRSIPADLTLQDE